MPNESKPTNGRSRPKWPNARIGRRMRRIPFSVVKGRITEETVEKLIRRYSVRPELARIYLGHEIREPEDLLRAPELGTVATPHELQQFMGDPGALSIIDVEDKVVEVAIASDRWSGATLGSRTLSNGATRAFIGDASGDLVSAELLGDDDIDFASIRFAGLRPFQLVNLDRFGVHDFISRIHQPLAVRAGRLWEREDSRLEAENRALYLLSQALRVLQGFTHGAAATVSGSVSPGTAPGGVAPPAGGIVDIPPDREDEVNGCTASPDFDFKDCCDQHDLCYIDGCTSCDRLACDWELYKCIVDRGWSKGRDYTALAATYYFAVRSAGESFFYYCDDRDPVYATVGGLLGAAVAVAGVFAGYVIGGPVGGAIGGAVGSVAGVLVAEGFGRVMCHLCEKVVEMEESCDHWVEKKWRECKTSYEKRKKRCKKKSWWKRPFCKLWAWVKKVVCRIVTGLVKVVCTIVTTVVKFVAC